MWKVKVIEIPSILARSMENPRSVYVFSALKPFLRLITAFNRDNFLQKHGQNYLRGVFNAILAALTHLVLILFLLLMVWPLIKNGADLKELMVLLPMVISLFQVHSSLIGFTMANRDVTDTIKFLQHIVDRSEFVSLT